LTAPSEDKDTAGRDEYPVSQPADESPDMRLFRDIFAGLAAALHPGPDPTGNPDQ
jgi:hypothetical protein